MTLQFRSGPGTPMLGALTYSHSEYSFHFEPLSWELVREHVDDSGATSVLVGTLQLELAVGSGTALLVSGYHPYMSWLEEPLSPPNAHPGRVFLVDDEGFLADVAVPLVETGQWMTVLDRVSGWVRVTADPKSEDDQVVLIASDTALGLSGDQLNSIWLHPIFES